jgi:hypothetical protein
LNTNSAEDEPKLNISTTIQKTPERVSGAVSCSPDQSKNVAAEKKATVARVKRLLLLNIVLVFALTVCVCAVFLAKATSQLMTSLAITLVTAVIAIVTSCFLSIGKKLVSKRHIFNKYIFPRLDEHGEAVEKCGEEKSLRERELWPPTLCKERKGWATGGATALNPASARFSGTVSPRTGQTRTLPDCPHKRTTFCMCPTRQRISLRDCSLPSLCPTEHLSRSHGHLCMRVVSRKRLTG